MMRRVRRRDLIAGRDGLLDDVVVLLRGVAFFGLVLFFDRDLWR